MVAGNQGFEALGSHGARQTHGRDKSPYRSPCHSYVLDVPADIKVRPGGYVQYTRTCTSHTHQALMTGEGRISRFPGSSTISFPVPKIGRASCRERVCQYV